MYIYIYVKDVATHKHDQTWTLQTKTPTMMATSATVRLLPKAEDVASQFIVILKLNLLEAGQTSKMRFTFARQSQRNYKS